eukprot:4059177-Amphidinium_carterae.1
MPEGGLISAKAPAGIAWLAASAGLPSPGGGGQQIIVGCGLLKASALDGTPRKHASLARRRDASPIGSGTRPVAHIQ